MNTSSCGHGVWLSSALKIGKILLLAESFLRNLKIYTSDSTHCQELEALVIHPCRSNIC